METVQDKPWWHSRTMVGIFVSTISMVFGAAGYTLDAGMLTEVITQVFTLAGLIWAWWGRRNATQPIDMGAVIPGVRIKPKRVPVPTDDSQSGPFGY